MTGTTRPPTLLIVTPYLPPHVGGVERYVGNLAQQLQRSGSWRVLLAAPRPRGEAGNAAADAAEFALAVDGIRVHWLPVTGTISNTPVGPGWRARLRELIRAEGVDIVNAHAPVPWLADQAARTGTGVPFVLTYHTGRMRKGHLLADLLLRAYEQYWLTGTLRRSSAVICASTHAADELPPCAVPRTVIPPAVDLSLFTPADTPATGRDGAAPARTLLFAGSLAVAARYKGLDDLLVAVQQVCASRPDLAAGLVLEVAGDGDHAAEYERLAASLGIGGRVRFRGVLQGEALRDAYRSAAALVVPSRYDNAPTVVAEALACGTPVIATRVGAIPQLLRDGEHGTLVPPGDPAALAAALAAVLADPEPAAQAAERGRAETVRDRGVDQLARHTAGVLEEALRRRPVRVAVLTPFYPPHVGGVEHYAAQVAGGLARLPGIGVAVITTRPGVRTVTGTVDGIPVIRVGSWLRLSNTPVSPLWLWQVPHLLRRLGADALHAHAPVPGLADLAAIIRGRRTLTLTYHSGSLVKGTGGMLDRVLGAYERWLLPWVMRRADHLAAVSPVSFAHRTGRSVLAPPGVDGDRFRPPAEPVPDAADTGAGRAPTVLFAGRMERSSAWKGVHVLVDALPELAREVPGIRLVLAGGGDAVPGLRARAASLGVAGHLCLPGQLAGPDLVAAYQQADVVVLPSLTEAESFGMTLIEAMACGRPVVGSRAGGIPGVVSDGTDGLLVPPGDATALARAVLRLLRDPALASRMGARGRRKVLEQFTWAECVGRYAGLMRQRPDSQTPDSPSARHLSHARGALT